MCAERFRVADAVAENLRTGPANPGAGNAVKPDVTRLRRSSTCIATPMINTGDRASTTATVQRVIIVSKVVLGLLAAAGVSTAGVVALSSGSPTESATVTRVIDGDTVDVDVHGQVERIRLLNIDTPETKDPNQPVECLGPEATEYLTGLLPSGTTVRLEYDRERIDRYDRTLAAVFNADGKLVNAEVARQGLAAVVVFDGNDRFYTPIAAARDEAAGAGRGLYSTEIACTVPGQVKAVTTTADSLVTLDAAAPSADLDLAVQVATQAVTLTAALDNAFASERLDAMWSAITDEERGRLGALVKAAHEKALRAERVTRSAADAARLREAAEAAERERQASEQTVREQAEQDAREQAAHDRGGEG